MVGVAQATLALRTRYGQMPTKEKSLKCCTNRFAQLSDAVVVIVASWSWKWCTVHTAHWTFAQFYSIRLLNEWIGSIADGELVRDRRHGANGMDKASPLAFGHGHWWWQCDSGDRVCVRLLLSQTHTPLRHRTDVRCRWARRDDDHHDDSANWLL